MAQPIGQILPYAIGVAIVPIPIIAMVLMLGTPRARSTGSAFAAGWLAGLGVVGGVTLTLATGYAAEDSGEPATWVGALKLTLGVAFVLLAARTWRGRPQARETAEMPAWMQKVDQLSPGRALVTGFALTAANPKNLALVIAASTTIAEAALPTGQSIAVLVVFIVIASVTVLAPLVIYLTMGDRATVVLDGLKRWMAANNATIMVVLLLVLGTVLIGNGLAEL